jgi:hypothetical protein
MKKWHILWINVVKNYRLKDQDFVSDECSKEFYEKKS